MITFNPQIKEINQLVNLSFQTDLFIQIFDIDLTTLNKIYGYEKATNYKNTILNEVNLFLKKSIIYEKVLGGKILVITNQEITTEFKKKIQLTSENLLNSDKKRYTYIFEEKIKKNILKLEDLLKNSIRLEIYLNKHRENIQKKLSEINKLSEIDDYGILFVNAITESKKIEIDLKKENVKELLNYVKHSYYLTQSLYAYLKDDKVTCLQFALAYKVWFDIQKILFQSYKTEKVSSKIIYRKTQKEFKFEDEFIKQWFNSSIKNLYPLFEQKELILAKQIEENIDSILQIEDENERKKLFSELIKKINAFTKKMQLKGIHSVPLDNLIPSQESRQFIQRQLHLQFNPTDNTQWQELTNNYLSQKFIKPEYKGYIKGDSNSVYQSIKILNQKLIMNTNYQHFHFGFLEIDFFNAFNSYLFPTDNDKFYKKILDVIFEISNQYIIKYPTIFKSLNIGLLGDEFFFTFLTEFELNKSQTEILKQYFTKINDEILNKTKTNLLVKSEKQVIYDKNKSELTLRVPMTKKSLFSKTENLDIGRISVSKYLLTNHKINFKLTTQQEFENIYNYVTINKMDEIKQKRIPEIVHENNLEKIKYNSNK